MDQQSNQIRIGDFLPALLNTEVDIVDNIFLRLNQTELSTCQLVAKSWTNYIDQNILGNTRKKSIVKQHNLLEAWSGIPRHITVNEILKYTAGRVDFVIYEAPILFLIKPSSDVWVETDYEVYENWQFIEKGDFFNAFESIPGSFTLPDGHIVTKNYIMYSNGKGVNFKLRKADLFSTRVIVLLDFDNFQSKKMFPVVDETSDTINFAPAVQYNSSNIKSMVHINVGAILKPNDDDWVYCNWKLESEWDALYQVGCTVVVGVKYCPTAQVDFVHVINLGYDQGTGEKVHLGLLYTRKRCIKLSICSFKLFEMDPKLQGLAIIFDNCCCNSNSMLLCCYDLRSMEVKWKKSILEMVNIIWTQNLAFIMIKSPEINAYELWCYNGVNFMEPMLLDPKWIPLKSNWLHLANNTILVPFEANPVTWERKMCFKIFEAKENIVHCISILWNWKPSSMETEICDPLLILDKERANIMIINMSRHVSGNITSVHSLSLRKVETLGREVKVEPGNEEDVKLAEMD